MTYKDTIQNEKSVKAEWRTEPEKEKKKKSSASKPFR
jgi:hypothetical protein